MAHVRMEPADRKKLILDAAFKVAKRDGFKKATRTAIAAEAGVTPGLIGIYFNGRDVLRNAILDVAIGAKDKKIIREALDIGAGKRKRIPKELRAA